MTGINHPFFRISIPSWIRTLCCNAELVLWRWYELRLFRSLLTFHIWYSRIYHQWNRPGRGTFQMNLSFYTHSLTGYYLQSSPLIPWMIEVKQRNCPGCFVQASKTTCVRLCCKYTLNRLHNMAYCEFWEWYASRRHSGRVSNLR